MALAGYSLLRLAVVATLLLIDSLALSLFDEADSAESSSRLLYYLTSPSLDHECDQGSSISEVIPVEGSLKLTTSEAPTSSRSRKLCHTPMAPFGEHVMDPNRGIGFWYLRLKVTQLAPGQYLYVVNTDYERMRSMLVNSDQRIDLSYRSHAYPVVLYLKYRYVRLYWNSTIAARMFNPVNITAATYAQFNDSVQTATREDLCQRYGHVWCKRSRAAVCISAGSCSMREDCFDAFDEPNRCEAGWLGGGGRNLTGLGSVGQRAKGWLLGRLHWLAFAALPLALGIALAKICAQQRRLDIDETYEYKPDDVEAAADGEEDDEEDAEVDGAVAVEAAGADAAAPTEQSSSPIVVSPYYSYPTCPPLLSPPSGSPPTPTSSSPPPALPPRSPGKSGSVDSETGESRGGLKVVPATTSMPIALTPVPPPTPPPRATPRRCMHLLAEERKHQHRYLQQLALEAEPQNQPPEHAGLLEPVRLRRLRATTTATAEQPVASGDYTSCRRASAPISTTSSRCSYTRLLNQPSPDTIEELLRPLHEKVAPTVEIASTEERVIYAQLVLPPPSSTLRAPVPPPRNAAAATQAAVGWPPQRLSRHLSHLKAPSAPAAAASASAVTATNCIEIRPPPINRRQPRHIASKTPPAKIPIGSADVGAGGGSSGGGGGDRRQDILTGDPYDLHYIVV